ncbi:response regulator [Persicobacter diffluens]|uniref:Response regulator n=1 Tax=Persicobacter diffluens TaxID=981 RepID=A0AAN4VZG1_9BACT|nr:response regulator [Persicobacter diffluens]
MKPIKEVLLIDDNAADNFYHSIILKESGYIEQVNIAENGFVALEMLKGQNHQIPIQPDIIFLDINMPAMNGWEFLKELEKISRFKKKDILVIMLSTSINPIDERKAIEFEAVLKFQSKPLEAEHVQALFSELGY